MKDLQEVIQSTPNTELEQIYAECRNVYDLTSYLITMLEDGENFEEVDTIREVGMFPLSVPNRYTNINTLPDIENVVNVELPSYWKFFFDTTLEFMAQAKGQTLSMDDEIEFTFTMEDFITQARLWVDKRTFYFPVLNTGAEGVKTLLDKVALDAEEANLKAFESTKEEDVTDSERESFKQYLTVQLDSKIKDLENRLVVLPVNVTQENVYSHLFELLDYYELTVAYVFVNDSGKTNLDSQMLLTLLSAARNNGIMLITYFGEEKTHPHLDTIKACLSFKNPNITLTDNAMQLFGVLYDESSDTE